MSDLELPTTGKICNCHLCQRHKRLREIMAKLPSEDADWLSALGDEFLDVGGDLNYYQAIHDGSWPSAVYVLEHALIRAKEKRENNPENYD